MAKKSPSINYKETITNPKFTKEFEEANTFELCVTMRLKELESRPNCNEKKEDLILRLKRNGIYKAVDLRGIPNAKALRKSLGNGIVYF